ncbi:hypothetical protein BGZ59_000313 [Podila verticillata]|nr:hypothetical protein BGZ59_000313 [Podila verticillata]
MVTTTTTTFQPILPIHIQPIHTRTTTLTLTLTPCHILDLATLVPTLSRSHLAREPTIPRTLLPDHININNTIHQRAQYDHHMLNRATLTRNIRINNILTQNHEPTQEHLNLHTHNNNIHNINNNNHNNHSNHNNHNSNNNNNPTMIKALTDPPALHKALNGTLCRPLRVATQILAMDEDDGEIKQESNRAHPSDGAAKNDNSEHEVHKCMDCGKVYKHPNCLWKHRWEHSTYWKSATKFLLSKHQQVRMMEAAAILLGIDEARAADKDMIVSTVIKQRGMGSSSSSSSPPTSTKSLSRSPPPSSEATRRRAASAKPTEQPKEESLPSSLATTPRPRPSVSETQNDIMMLTALRKASSAPSKISGDQPQAVPSISPKNPSSSSSTPPTLADDESVPELDEMVVSPPQPSGPNPTDKGMGLGMGMSVGMSMAMDVDPKHYSRDPHQPFHAQQPSQQAYRFPSSYQHPPHPSYPTQQ